MAGGGDGEDEALADFFCCTRSDGGGGGGRVVRLCPNARFTRYAGFLPRSCIMSALSALLYADEKWSTSVFFDNFSSFSNSGCCARRTRATVSVFTSLFDSVGASELGEVGDSSEPSAEVATWS